MRRLPSTPADRCPRPRRRRLCYAAWLGAALLLALTTRAALAGESHAPPAAPVALGEPPAGAAGAHAPTSEPPAASDPAAPGGGTEAKTAPGGGDPGTDAPGDPAPGGQASGPDAPTDDTAKKADPGAGAAPDKAADGKPQDGDAAKDAAKDASKDASKDEDDGGFPLDLKWDGGPVLEGGKDGPRLRVRVIGFTDKVHADDHDYATARRRDVAQQPTNLIPVGGRLGKTDTTDPIGHVRVVVDGRLTPDIPFKGSFGATRDSFGIRDFFVDVKAPPLPCVCLCDPDLRIGNMLEPMGLERNTDLDLTTFVSRSAASMTFGLGHSTGAMLHDGLYGGHLGYALGFFYSPRAKNGEFSDRDSDETVVREGFGTTGRVWWMPWTSRHALCHRLLLGASASVRTGMSGIRFRSRPESYSFGYAIDTDFSRDFTGRPLLDDAKSASFFGAEASWVGGRWFAQGEWFLSHVTSPRGGDPTFTGGYVMAGLWLTRECRRLDCGRLQPSEICCPLDPCADRSGLGGLELAVRYSTVDLNDGNVLGGTMDNWSLELNWWLGHGRRLMFNYVRAQVADGFVSEPIHIFQFRFQLGI